MAAYEYKAIVADTLPAPEQLDALGEEGWRMVQIVPVPSGATREPVPPGTLAIYLIREKPCN